MNTRIKRRDPDWLSGAFTCHRLVQESPPGRCADRSGERHARHDDEARVRGWRRRCELDLTTALTRIGVTMVNADLAHVGALLENIQTSVR
jgi:hypothetical protein